VLAGLGLALGQAGPAAAASFSVNPTQVFLTSGTPTKLLGIRNESNRPLRFQLTVFAWNQNPKGEMQLAPTSDIIFFPPLLTLAPKEDRNVRIGVAARFATIEKTYRLFIEELPPPEKPLEGQTGVTVLTRVGIPVFMEPPAPVARGTLQVTGIQKGTLAFQVNNTGNVHFLPERVRVQGLDRTGAIVLHQQVDGWYILAGGSRVYELPLPPSDCARITALQIEVQVGETTLKQRLDTPKGACAP
jgi:fimbrial chaperone protein